MTVEAPDLASAKLKKLGIGAIVSKLGPLFGLVAVFALFALLRPERFLSVNNFQIMLLQTAVVGTAALGMTMIIIAGGIDLSIGSNIALCTVIVALVLKYEVPYFDQFVVDHHSSTFTAHLLQWGVAPISAALAGIAVSSLCGLLVGSLITRLRLMPFIVTLGTLTAYRGLAKLFANSNPIQAPATWLNDLLKLPSDHAVGRVFLPILHRVDWRYSIHVESCAVTEQWYRLPPGVWIMLVLTLAVSLMFRYTRFGRHIFAIGSNEQTARLCGVPVERMKVLIYVVGLAFAGIAGILQFSYLTEGDPTTAAGYELAIIAAVVIGGASLNGGQGSVLGSLIGALIMTVVNNGCNKVDLQQPVQDIVTGGIIILAVVLDQLRHRKAD
jgi:ribose transport system permease protein